MRKLTHRFALAFFMLGSIAPGMALAESIEKANQKDIAMLLAAASRMNSAYQASLIGETGGRVFIEYETGVYASSMFSKGPKRVVYWLPRSEITDEQLTQLKTCKDRFRFLDALKAGMTQGEAAAAMTSIGFERRNLANRPAAGWAERDNTLENLQGRAFQAEKTFQKAVVVAEWWYPVGPGPSEASTLCLFYGSDGRLLERYPCQIN